MRGEIREEEAMVVALPAGARVAPAE
jgi:hypothetical protein